MSNGSLESKLVPKRCFSCQTGEITRSEVGCGWLENTGDRPISFHLCPPGKDFLRAAQMNISLATWVRLMMNVFHPCSSLEPLSPPLTAPCSACTPSPTGPEG